MQQRLEPGDSLRAIGRSLGRSPSTISRECHRTSAERAGYKAQTAQQHSQVCRRKPRVTRKPDDAALWETVHALLRARWSPEQIAGILARVLDRRGRRLADTELLGCCLTYPCSYTFLAPIPMTLQRSRPGLIGCDAPLPERASGSCRLEAARSKPNPVLPIR